MVSRFSRNTCTGAFLAILQLWECYFSKTKANNNPSPGTILADSWHATLMSCLLYSKSSNSESLQEKQKRILPQPGLNYSTEFVFCMISTFHWQSSIYTLTFSDGTAAPRNILEKAIHNIIFHSLPVEFFTLDSSEIHYQVYLKTGIDNQLSSCEHFKSSLHSFSAFLSLGESYPWNSPAEDKSS